MERLGNGFDRLQPGSRIQHTTDCINMLSPEEHQIILSKMDSENEVVRNNPIQEDSVDVGLDSNGQWFDSENENLHESEGNDKNIVGNGNTDGNAGADEANGEDDNFLQDGDHSCTENLLTYEDEDAETSIQRCLAELNKSLSNLQNLHRAQLQVNNDTGKAKDCKISMLSRGGKLGNARRIKTLKKKLNEAKEKQMIWSGSAEQMKSEVLESENELEETGVIPE